MGGKKLRILLISDTEGDDDEGMKKIARKLSYEFNRSPNIVSQIAPPLEASALAGSFDVFHYIGGPSYRSVLLGWYAKVKNRNITSILTFTNPFWGPLANTLIRILPPNHVIVSSNHWKNWAVSLRINWSMFSISGVDVEKFKPVDAAERVTLRKKLGLPLESKIVLHVGHLKQDRNLTALLAVQAELNTQVIIVASTTTKQSNELLGQLSKAGCIVISTYQKTVEEYYQAADCYVFPTIDNKAAVQVPLSVLEALAVGLPVISTPFGGLPDLFGEEQGVYFYQPTALEDRGLVKKIDMVLALELEGIKLDDTYSWPAIAEKLSTLYSKISKC